MDPLMGTEIALEDPQRWNRYSYVGNRPTRIVDPDGRGWLSTLVKLVVKGGDVAATFAGVVEDFKTLAGRDSTLGERGTALLMLGSEALPVSGRDVGEVASFASSHFGSAVRSSSSIVRNVDGGIATADDALRGATKWLGDGYKEIAPGVFRSKDGKRQFRMTSSDLTDPKFGQHVHFESIGPDGRTIIENSHVLIGR